MRKKEQSQRRTDRRQKDVGKEQKDKVKVTGQTVSYSGGNFSLSSHAGQTESQRHYEEFIASSDVTDCEEFIASSAGISNVIGCGSI